MNVYNEIDPFASRWLEALVGAGEIADGRVESRSIEDIRPEEVASAPQFHTFAGIGVWSYALRLAGWPDDRPVWTGSCPCQPFSSAGKRGGFEDERHLWPAWFRLIRECRPPVIFGEQVASKDGLAWLDAVYADLEGEGYAVGAADLCAAGVGAPHIRQRLFFVAERVADADNARREGWIPRRESSQRRDFDRHAGCGGAAIRLADSKRGDGRGEHGHGVGRAARAGEARAWQRERVWVDSADGGAAIGMDDTAGARHVGALAGAEGEAWDEARLRLSGEGRGSGGLADTEHYDGRADESWRGPQGRVADGRSGAAMRLADAAARRRAFGVNAGSGDATDSRGQGDGEPFSGNSRPSPTNGHWRAADWLFCQDGKWRPVESGTFPLAHGAPARVGRLRGYGNAIVAQAAAEVIRAYMDA